MRKVIERYAAGIFETNARKLCFSIPKIEAALPSDEISDGSFRIFSSDNKTFNADFYSSDMRVVVRTNHVSGEDVMVHYVFDPTGLENGHEIKGDIQVVSDCGEYYLPFCFTVVKGYAKSSLGNIRNLFHFTNQAQTNWDESVSLFYSKQFLQVFEGNDRIHLDKYRGLSNIKGNGQAVEDFLVAVNKKRPITYNVDRNSYEFNEVTEELRCEVELHKSTWGYVDVDLSKDGEFIALEKNHLGYGDFLGNTHKLVFYIDGDKLHEGKNYGVIKIKSNLQEIEITIIARLRQRTNAARIERRERRNLMCRLMRHYIDFRMKKTSVGSWVRESMKIVERFNALDDKNPVSRLYQAQLLLVQQRFNEANWILEHVEAEMNIQSYGEKVYAYFRYLKSLYVRDDTFIEDACAEIRDFYKNNPTSFELLWMLFYLDENLSQNSNNKIDEINALFDRGCTSPVLYIEAYNFYAANPEKLSKIGHLEEQMLLLAIKNGVMDNEIRKQVLYVAGKVRTYSDTLYKILDGIYKISGDEEIVGIVTTLLIKGGKMGPQYFSWFEKAVDMQLRITRVYENYMYCLPRDFNKPLPKQVLMYFNFRNDLESSKIARLYVNLINHKRELLESYEAYRENMQVFAVEQIADCHIDKELAVIYKDVLFPEMIQPSMAANLSKLLFTNEVEAPDDAQAVILIQDQFEGEQRFPVIAGRAYPFIYSYEYTLFYENASGRRWPVEADKVKKLLNEAVFVPSIKNYVNDNVYFSMYLCEGKRHYVVVDDENVDFCRELADSDKVRENYKREIRMALLHYYYDNDQITTLDEFLQGLDIRVLTAKDRAEVVKFCVRRGMYEKAYQAVSIYGMEEVSAKVCVRICNHMIAQKDQLPDAMLIKMCYYAFKKGKYDEVTLKYLVENYNGLTKELRNIWRAAVEFDVESYPIIERMLIQMLYAHTTVGEKEEVFDMYIKLGASSTVEMAYLSYSAYEYFSRERLTDDSVFKHIIRNYRNGEKLNDACMLGLLKYYAEEKSEYNLEEQDMITSFVIGYIHRNIYFRFFNKFVDLVPELADYEYKTYVEYRTAPGNRVTLHYILESSSSEEENYKSEEMRNMFGGVFSREFVLFFGEKLQYYITEEENGKELLTASDVITLSDTAADNGESRYSILNDMVVSRTVKDETTLDKLMSEYVDADAFTKHMFKLR